MLLGGLLPLHQQVLVLRLRLLHALFGQAPHPFLGAEAKLLAVAVDLLWQSEELAAALVLAGLLSQMRLDAHLGQQLFGWAGQLHGFAKPVGLGIVLGWLAVASQCDYFHSWCLGH